MTIQIDIQQLSWRYPQQQSDLFCQLDLMLPAGQWTCLLGKSGCGKSSLLKLLAGISPMDPMTQMAFSAQELNGQVRELSSINIAYMGQNDALYPWFDVLNNVCLVERLRCGQVCRESQQQALTLLAELGLADYANSAVYQLSGGMKQRVALARVLMQQADVVLMDEPFSALDALTRYQLQNLAAQRLKDKTVLLITHDPQEALRLADQLVVMSGCPSQITTIAIPQDMPPAPRELDTSLYQLQQQLLHALATESAFESEAFVSVSEVRG